MRGQVVLRKGGYSITIVFENGEAHFELWKNDELIETADTIEEVLREL